MILLEIPAERVFLGVDAQLLWNSLAGARMTLSEALLASQPRGEQKKILKFEFAPLASSTMYANTLRPRILALTSFIWS